MLPSFHVVLSGGSPNDHNSGKDLAFQTHKRISQITNALASAEWGRDICKDVFFIPEILRENFLSCLLHK